MKDKKVCIVGLGPAGISAAIYLLRSGIKPTIFEPKKLGGKLNIIREIDNYPSFIGTGEELKNNMENQLLKLEPEIIHNSVTSIYEDENGFLVRTPGQDYVFDAVLVSSGILERPYKVPGSDSYHEVGLSRCAECDAPFYKGKTVACLVQDEGGIKEALYLASVVEKVELIYLSSKEIDKEYLEKLEKTSNISIHMNDEIKDSSGSMHIEKIVLKSGVELDVSALFIFIGSTPIAEFLGYMDILDAKGYIKVDENMMTKVKGLFAAGDIKQGKLKQVVTACSDGAIAAVGIRNYLNELKNE